MQTPAQTSDAQMGIVFIVSLVAAIIDWRYKRQGGKKPTTRDRWMFCAACGICLMCLLVLGLMGASAEVLGAMTPGLLVLLFAVWEVGRWRIRRKNPVVKRGNEKIVIIDYAGDDPNKNRMVSWFQTHCHAIATCLNAELPEASLVLIYSGFDTFGLLSAPPNVLDATGDTYKRWCEKYILPRIKSVEGDPVTAVDLWGARCGVLHTSTPLSKLEREGKAHQIWYQFVGKAGVNLIMDSKLPPLGLDVQNLALAFKEGGIACITDINQDPAAFQVADARAQHFLRWGKVVS